MTRTRRQEEAHAPFDEAPIATVDMADAEQTSAATLRLFRTHDAGLPPSREVLAPRDTP